MQVGEDQLQQLIKWQLPQDQLDRLREKIEANKQEKKFPVHLDAWPSLEMFFNLLTQWNKVIIGGFASAQKLTPLGLRYEAVEPTFRLSKVYVPKDDRRRLLEASEWPDVFADLQTMERVLIENFSKGD